MGGHAAGEVASRVAADAIEAFIQHTDGADRELHVAVPFRPEWGIDGNRLVSAFLLANREIRQRIARRTRAARDGDDGGVPAARQTGCRSPGDAQAKRRVRAPSRARPRCPPSSPTSATRARTCGATANSIRSRATTRGSRSRSPLGVLNEDEARQHPWRNLVTRALAGAEEPRRRADAASPWSPATASCSAATA